MLVFFWTLASWRFRFSVSSIIIFSVWLFIVFASTRTVTPLAWLWRWKIISSSFGFSLFWFNSYVPLGSWPVTWFLSTFLLFSSFLWSFSVSSRRTAPWWRPASTRLAWRRFWRSATSRAFYRWRIWWIRLSAPFKSFIWLRWRTPWMISFVFSCLFWRPLSFFWLFSMSKVPKLRTFKLFMSFLVTIVTGSMAEILGKSISPSIKGSSLSWIFSFGYFDN